MCILVTTAACLGLETNQVNLVGGEQVLKQVLLLAVCNTCAVVALVPSMLQRVMCPSNQSGSWLALRVA